MSPTYERIDGDGEYSVSSSGVDMVIDGDDVRHYLYGKRGNLYAATETGAGVTLGTPLVDHDCSQVGESYFYRCTVGDFVSALVMPNNDLQYLYSTSSSLQSYQYPGPTYYEYAGGLNALAPGGSPVSLDFSEGGNSQMGANGGFNDMAVDSQGLVHVAYQKYQYQLLPGPEYRYWAVAYTNSDQWSGEPTIVDDSGDNWYRWIEVMVDSQDTVYLGYYSYDYSDPGIRLATLTKAGWTIDAIVSPATYYSDPAFAVDDQDYLHLVYRDHDNSRLVYGTNQSGSWLFEEVPDGSSDPSDPDNTAGLTLTIDAADRPVVAYINNTDKLLHYLVRDTAGWTDSSAAAPATVATTTRIRLSWDSAGRLHLAYEAGHRLWHQWVDLTAEQ